MISCRTSRIGCMVSRIGKKRSMISYRTRWIGCRLSRIRLYIGRAGKAGGAGLVAG